MEGDASNAAADAGAVAAAVGDCGPPRAVRPIVVRWLAVDAVPEAAWAGLTALLDDGERARAARFVFAPDRQSFVAAHALLRALLSQHDPARSPADWRFAAGPYGRPELVVPAARPAAWPAWTNLSHTRGRVAVALGWDGEVGIDVEAAASGALSLSLAREVFSADEVAHLETLAGPAQTEALVALWTLKEAVVKALGTGLSQPLASFTVHHAPPSLLGGDAVVTAHAWDLWRWRLPGDFALALALKRQRQAVAGEPAPAVDIAEALPSALWRVVQGTDGAGAL